MESVLKFLREAKSGEAVDEGLGMINSCAREEIELYRQQCVQVLNELSMNEEMMNAKLRRKLKRILQFVLSGSTTDSSETTTGEAKTSTMESTSEPANPSHLLSEMKNCMNLLQKCQAINEIEESISRLPMTEFVYRDQNVNRFIFALESFPERSDIQINAKLRRRVKRLVETLTSLPSSSFGSGSAQGQSQGQEAEETVVVTVVKKVPLTQTLQLLNSVRSFNDLEYSLNSMELPDFQTIKSSPGGEQIMQQIATIQTILEKFLLNDDGTLTNRKLRHRLKKIIYVLSGGGVNIKRTTQVPDHTPPSTREISAMAMTSSASSKPKPQQQLPSKANPTHPLLTSIRNLKTAEELSEILTGIPTRSDELLNHLQNSREVVKAIDEMLSERVELSSGEENSKKILLTAKVRRKVLRFVDALREILSPPVVEPEPEKMELETPLDESFDEDNAEIKIVITAASAPLSKKRKMEEATEVEAAAPAAAPEVSIPEPEEEKKVAEPLMTYEDFILSLRRCDSSESLEKLLQPFCSNWKEMLGIGSCKTRRSLKRALDSLLSSGDSTDLIGSPASSAALAAVVAASPATQELITQALTTLDEVTAAAIQAHLDQNSVSSVATGVAAGGAGAETQKKKKQKVETSQVKSNESAAGASAVGAEGEGEGGVLGNVSSHKHILFIGQLSYETTSDDLLNHLKSAGVEGDISVRILTDKNTGKSRGAAFIDFFGGKRSLKRIMDLHHTTLNGRRINVEHTAKHTNTHSIPETELHSLNTKQQRMQQKILDAERVDILLREHAHLNLGSKGGMLNEDHLMNRLYAMTVQEVKDILAEYSRKVMEKRGEGEQGQPLQGNLALFRKLISKRDGGGSAVDQTREQKGFFESYHGGGRGERSGRGAAAGREAGGERSPRPSIDESQIPPSSRGGGGGRGGGMGRGGSGRGGVFEVFRGRGGR